MTAGAAPAASSHTVSLIVTAARSAVVDSRWSSRGNLDEDLARRATMSP